MHRNARGDGGLAGGVLAAPGGEHVAEDHLPDAGGVDAGAFEGGADRGPGQRGGGDVGETPPKRPIGVRAAARMTVDSWWIPMGRS
nr:hypothetical protein GCM10025732_34230 [Glycomyces mayteni]